MSGSSKLTINEISGSSQGINVGRGVLAITADSLVLSGGAHLDTLGLGGDSTLRVDGNVSGEYVTKIFNDHGTAGHVLKLETDGTGAGTRILEMEEGGGSTVFRARADGRFGFGSTGVGSMGAGTFVVGIGGGHTADIAISKRLQHLGDSDTYIDFTAADQVDVVAGGHNMVHMTEAASGNHLYILSGTSGLPGVSFDPAGATDISFWVSGSADSKGMPYKGVSAIGGDLAVSGTLYGTAITFNDQGQMLRKLEAASDKILLSRTVNVIGQSELSYGNANWHAKDVFLYVSGSSKKYGQPGEVSGFQHEGVTVFGGDVMVSGTLQTSVTDVSVPQYGSPTGNILLSGSRGVTAYSHMASSGHMLVMPNIFSGVGTGVMMTVKNQSTSDGLVLSGSTGDLMFGTAAGNLFLTTGSLSGLVEKGGGQLGIYTLPAKSTATFISREGGGSFGYAGYWDVIDECEIASTGGGGGAGEDKQVIQVYASVTPSANPASAQYMMSTVMGTAATGDFLKDIKTYVVAPFDGEVGGITVAAWDAVSSSTWGSNMGINVYKNGGASGNYTSPSASTMTGGGSSGFAGDSFSTKVNGPASYPDVESINVSLSTSLSFSKGDVLQFVFSPSGGSQSSAKDVIVGVELKAS